MESTNEDNKSWTNQAEVVKEETRAALQAVFDELNHGQRQKLLKSEKVRELLDRYGVDTLAPDTE